MMERDPIINVVHQGIKNGIRVTLENSCFSSAIILIYSGIDTMAFLGMPSTQTDVTRNDFINWCDKYIKFHCNEQLTGLDLYGARCGVLHNHSSYSRLSRSGQCRLIGYMSKSVPEIRYEPKVSKELVLVSVPALAGAFFEGVDKFLIDLFANKDKAKIAEERFKTLLHTLQVNSQSQKEI